MDSVYFIDGHKYLYRIVTPDIHYTNLHRASSLKGNPSNFFSQQRRPVSCILVNDASQLTFICFTAANHKIKTQFSDFDSEIAHQNKKIKSFFSVKNVSIRKWPTLKMDPLQNGPY